MGSDSTKQMSSPADIPGMDRSESWLLPDDTDRARMLDMDRRLQPIRRAAFAVLAVGLLIVGPWIGWWTLVPLLLAAVLFAAADRTVDRVQRPEYWIFAAWVGSQCMIAISVVLAGAPETPAMAWFAIPVTTLATRFSMRGVVVGVGITLALMLGVAFGSGAAAVIDEPPMLVMPIALVLAIGILTTALMRSDVEHRSEAVIDPLTSMLNRKALSNRVEEIRQQSEVNGAPIAVVMIDIDNFKQVNDIEGHATGDHVLREVAYIIRKDLRAFELAYRLGGEEFLVLLPGADREHALMLAERLRERVHASTYGVRPLVTISCGVAASEIGERLDFDGLMEAADKALYEAKRTGRNRALGASTGDFVAA